jgi:hypothetical protein
VDLILKLWSLTGFQVGLPVSVVLALILAKLLAGTVWPPIKWLFFGGNQLPPGWPQPPPGDVQAGLMLGMRVVAWAALIATVWCLWSFGLGRVVERAFN